MTEGHDNNARTPALDGSGSTSSRKPTHRSEPEGAAATYDRSGAQDIWLLEDSYPEIEGLLASTDGVSAGSGDALVVLDTNALLLPFEVTKSELSEIGDAYRKLAEEKRLFVPARVIREYLKNRDDKLSKIVQGTGDASSKALSASGEFDIPPLLSDMPETKAMKDALQDLTQARKKYRTAAGKLVDKMKSWKGNDPVTKIYHELFRGEVLLDTSFERREVEAQWDERNARMIPPGYKDARKSDKGIGDFLIWLAILELGETRKRDLIFVTGEQKADWFVRANREGIYPRPELVDEYRRASGGKRIRLSKLADVLADMNVPENVVKDVRDAEAEANSAIQASSTSKNFIMKAEPGRFLVEGGESDFSYPIRSFDYSTNDGRVSVGSGEHLFVLKFSKASDRSIYLYTTRETPYVARVRSAVPGMQVVFTDFDTSSQHYLIQVGEAFLAKNSYGFVLAGRLLEVDDDTRGALRDQVKFIYAMGTTNDPIVIP